MWNLKKKIRFQIIAQYRDNRLMVNILEKSLYFVLSAQQISKTPQLLNGFSKEDIELIEYITYNQQSVNESK